MSTAYFLVTHGSSDPRSLKFVQEIVELTQRQLAQRQINHSLIGGGCLEGQELSLAQQLQHFGRIAQSRGCEAICVLPLFLLPGVHVCVDIPTEVMTAQQYFGQSLNLQVLPYLGGHPEIPRLLEQKFQKIEQQFITTQSISRILVAHGSKRNGGNQAIATLANSLQALPAYWSVAPSLETQIEYLREQRAEYIAVLPYFLVPGGITEAIRQTIEQYAIPSEFRLGYESIAISLSEIATLVTSQILISSQLNCLNRVEPSII